jgi:hypothetical protein
MYVLLFSQIAVRRVYVLYPAAILEKPPSSTAKAQPAAPTSAPASTAPKAEAGKELDFFSSIEEQQPTMFNPQTNR